MSTRVNAQRVVLKIGTSSLVSGGEVVPGRVAVLADAIAELVASGHQPVLVASGAIALGREDLPANAAERPAARRMAAALGQGPFFDAFRGGLRQRGIGAAQLLLTPLDLVDGPHPGSVREGIEGLLGAGIVPVVNENDAIMVRNNDILAALLSVQLAADLLVLVTDVPGLCEAPGSADGQVRRLVEVDLMAPEVERLVREPVSGVGSGGMSTKVSALWIAAYAGVSAVVTGAVEPDALLGVVRGADIGTRVRPCQPADRPGAQRLWHALSALPNGRVRGGPEAVRQLRAGGPLRAEHVLDVEGEFRSGDVVDVLDLDARPLARGRARLDAQSVANDPAAAAEALLVPTERVLSPLWTEVARTGTRKEAM